jgi:two-component system, chemotaxis family, sensor kinase CheA
MAEQTPNAFPTFENEMKEILESFIVETKEIFEQLGPNLLRLEKTPSDAELLNTIFRAVHTVKGTSSFLGFDQMTSLAHVFEDVLNKLRKGEIHVTGDGMDVMFAAFDSLKVLLEKIEAGNAEPEDLKDIIAKLKVLASGAAPAENTPAPPGAVQPEVTAAAVAAVPDPVPAPPPSEETDPQAKSGAAPADRAAAKQADTTIRVDVNRLDSLMDLVGELVLGRNRLNLITDQMNQKMEGTQQAKDLSDTFTQIDFITTELQMVVMKTRMVPIAKVFNKLPRLVRDLSKETGKEIELVMTGEDTELDKSIIEELNDPLIHIMRNAADHGIERPDVRQAAGKPVRGTISVSAVHEGNHIVLAIEDDGHGMDPERLKQKAIERGMITSAEAREMLPREAFNLIFDPGFSTAEKVTNVSGRGVGMDVVRTNITNLKGIIEIESTLGKGSRFIIKLPLTLAIIKALLVDVAGEILSIPLASVQEVRRIQTEEIATVHGKEVIRLRDTVLPLTRVGYLSAGREKPAPGQWLYVVVVALGTHRFGIVVDGLMGQKEVVIKSLGSYLGTVPGIAGSTILGDGRVIMIVDVGELMKVCTN